MTDALISKNFSGIIDSTLREGRQFRHANFTLSQQVEIVKMLSLVGIDYIEVGNPIVSKISKEIKRLLRVKGRSPFLAHVRNKLSDIKAASSIEVEGVNILCSIDDARLSTFNISFKDYLEELKTCIRFAKEHRLEVRVSVEHVFNADEKNVFMLFEKAQEWGVDRIGIADTLGCAMNWSVEEKIKAIRKTISVPIEVHFHNDLSLSVSNSITAVRNGANWIDTTLLGIGERSGITPLSTLLVSLFVLHNNCIRRYKMYLLTQIENRFALLLGKEVPFHLLTNEKSSFAHKAGIHLHAIVRLGPQVYEPIAPKIIGNRRTLISGSKISGRTDDTQINSFYKKYGID